MEEENTGLRPVQVVHYSPRGSAVSSTERILRNKVRELENAVRRERREKEELKEKVKEAEERAIGDRTECGLLRQDRKLLIQEVENVGKQRDAAVENLQRMEMAVQALDRHVDRLNRRLEEFAKGDHHRSVTARQRDAMLRKHFGLPETEVIVTSFFGVHESAHGHLYVTPSYVCFDAGASRLPVNDPVFAMRIVDVVEIIVGRYLWVCSTFEMRFVDGQQKMIYFIEAERAVRNIQEEADRMGHTIKVTHDYLGKFLTLDTGKDIVGGPRPEKPPAESVSEGRLTRSTEPRRRSIDNSHLRRPSKTLAPAPSVIPVTQSPLKQSGGQPETASRPNPARATTTRADPSPVGRCSLDSLRPPAADGTRKRAGSHVIHRRLGSNPYDFKAS